jgi:hypothetical protein
MPMKRRWVASEPEAGEKAGASGISDTAPTPIWRTAPQHDLGIGNGIGIERGWGSDDSPNATTS